MSRDRFISDNLYSMRDRFKQNHAEHVSVPGFGDDGSKEEIISMNSPEKSAEIPHPSPVSSVPSSVPRLPALAAADTDPENIRERRDLEGRLLRDLSFIETENELIRRKTDAINRFRNVAEELLNELNAGKLTSRQIDLLRIKYFQAYGSFEASVSNSKNAEFQAPQTQKSQSNWPMVAAIIISAAMVSLTLLLLFGR